MSLFQGAASIHINNSAQDRLEEQEELEDRKRLNEEVTNYAIQRHNLLTKFVYNFTLDNVCLFLAETQSSERFR